MDMDIQILILGIFVVLIVVWCSSKQKDVYTPEYAKQIEQNCKLDCFNIPNLGCSRLLHRNSPDCGQCLEACEAQNPY